jgi:lipopolysaccharide/colanic/teichoic acid biosynthesis glycosyltransferase
MRVFGGLLIIPASPIIIVLMALVRITSSGPALYRQTRVGKDGREFTIFKLRTMYQDAEKLTGPVWCRRNDSRVTPLGKILRQLHLDELPQLWNVARGDMDLIGPRPERPSFVRGFVNDIPDYQNRHLVRPGITGLAQVNLPADETIESVHRKLVLDLEYINSARLGVDLRILACTAFRMCGLRHGRAVRFFRLERTVLIKPGSREAACGVQGLKSTNGDGFRSAGILSANYISDATVQLSIRSDATDGCNQTTSSRSVSNRPK